MGLQVGILLFKKTSKIVQKGKSLVCDSTKGFVLPHEF